MASDAPAAALLEECAWCGRAGFATAAELEAHSLRHAEPDSDDDEGDVAVEDVDTVSVKVECNVVVEAGATRSLDEEDADCVEEVMDVAEDVYDFSREEDADLEAEDDIYIVVDDVTELVLDGVTDLFLDYVTDEVVDKVTDLILDDVIAAAATETSALSVAAGEPLDQALLTPADEARCWISPLVPPRLRLKRTYRPSRNKRSPILRELLRKRTPAPTPAADPLATDTVAPAVGDGGASAVRRRTYPPAASRTRAVAVVSVRTGAEPSSSEALFEVALVVPPAKVTSNLPTTTRPSPNTPTVTAASVTTTSGTALPPPTSAASLPGNVRRRIILPAIARRDGTRQLEVPPGVVQRLVEEKSSAGRRRQAAEKQASSARRRVTSPAFAQWLAKQSEGRLCSFCERWFPSRQLLARHRLAEHIGEQSHRCCKCAFTCQSAERLASHVACAHSLLRLRCPACPSWLPSTQLLGAHLQIRHGVLSGPALLPCPVGGCRTEFVTIERLVVHAKKQHGRILHIHCDACDHRSTRVQLALEHVEAHEAAVRALHCEVCARWFPSAALLAAHALLAHRVRDDDAALPGDCVCGELFAERVALLRHARESLHEARPTRVPCPHCVSAGGGQPQASTDDEDGRGLDPRHPREHAEALMGLLPLERVGQLLTLIKDAIAHATVQQSATEVL